MHLQLMVAVLSIKHRFYKFNTYPSFRRWKWIIFVILEGIGVKVNKKFEDYIHRIGMVLLFSLYSL